MTKDCPHCVHENELKRYLQRNPLIWLGFATANLILAFFLRKIDTEINQTALVLTCVWVCLFIPTLIERWVGKKYYFSLDQEGTLHVHRELFSGGYLGKKADGNTPRFIKGYVIEVKIGLTTKGRIFVPPSQQWMHPVNPLSPPLLSEYRLLEQTWSAERVGFRGYDLWHPIVWLGFRANERYRRSVEAALGMMVQHAEDAKTSSSLLESQEAWRTVERQRSNRLGFLIVRVLESIRSDRASLGRSKHAQHIRELLEEGIREFSLSEIAGWREEIQSPSERDDAAAVRIR